MTNTSKKKLTAKWSKRQKDVVFYHPTDRSDGYLLYWLLSVAHGNEKLSFLDELERRGYDITTLKFSVCKKEEHQQDKKN